MCQVPHYFHGEQLGNLLNLAKSLVDEIQNPGSSTSFIFLDLEIY